MSDGSHGVRPHRGTLILVLGILGLVVCFICGIVAWTMGNADLDAMARGEMDRSGEDMTKIGKVLGIVSVALLAVGVLVGIGILVLGVGAASLSR